MLFVLSVMTTYCNVFIHLEKMCLQSNLLHVGVSFEKMHGVLRYDFRAFNERNRVYRTVEKERSNVRVMFPDLCIPESYDDSEYKRIAELIRKNPAYAQKIPWGRTKKTFSEIILFEKELNNPYVIGVYDCRHYVRDFTKWAVDKPIPVWTLHEIWTL